MIRTVIGTEQLSRPIGQMEETTCTGATSAASQTKLLAERLDSLVIEKVRYCTVMHIRVFTEKIPEIGRF